jgi:S1-C subfamily serine protease
VLVIAATAIGGAGLGRVIWPTSASTSSAAGGSGNSSSGGSSGTQTTIPGYYPFGGSGGTGSGGSQSSEGAGGPSDVAAIAAKVAPALVDVNVTFDYEQAEGAGTGIVLTSDGLVLTNNHVIDEATKITVTDVGNGRTYTAAVVGYDNTHDVAVLQLQGASGLATAKVFTASPSVGEAVVAIGNAGGTGGTPTSAGGSITNLNQSITASDELTQTNEQLKGLIEVNANIESGDSGGSLVNASGQVIGMDTAASEGNFAFSSEGNQGYAIPIDDALAVVKDVESGNGTSTVHVGATAFLGLLLSAPSESDPSFGGGSAGLSTSGLDVESVVGGSPAEQIGITGGDVITSFNGTRMTSEQQLTHTLVAYHPGQRAQISWVDSSGQSHTAAVTLASGPPS